MTKKQRLRTTAEGFMAGLVANGYRGPWRWRNLGWELPFYRVWREWTPPQERPQDFPSFELAGTGKASQGRAMLWELKRTSPFHRYREEQLPDDPLGLSPREYLEIYAPTARPTEWIALASGFLASVDSA